MAKDTTNKKPADFLDRIVTVKIDRPINSKHDKFDMIYELNYGFVPDTLAPDGEEIDAYVLGIDKPISEFVGRCSAIIHRANDNDDKLVVVPDGLNFSDEEIRAKVDFQEKWFESKIIRK
jgi:inorganic pyrophosphatase